MMQIHNSMNLSQLAERMGSEATQEDAERMRALLVEHFDGQDTADIAEADWLALLNRAAKGNEKVVVTTDTKDIQSMSPEAAQAILSNANHPESYMRHMQAFNEAWAAARAAGLAAMSDEVRAVVEALTVGERLTVELGRIERANDKASLDLARGKADAFLSSALAYNNLRKVDDWKLLDRHIDKRANARRAEIQTLS